jgi:two-component system, OmpR family, alkaline phosphatase synthesis response regulator PhoP
MIMGGHSILIIDDDPNIVELLSVNLLASGYDVNAAVDGKDAQSKIMRRPPELIVLDIMMPEMDGWELCKWIRDDPFLKDVKIIMLTAKGTEKDKLIGREILQADEYMTKPFDIDELKKNVERLLHA